jgi:hypothetical protein
VWGNLCVQAGENIREMCESIAWDMSGTGITVQWKEHQLVDSSSRILIMCVRNIFDKEGLKEELLFHMKAVERKMVTKGKLPASLLTEPIPLITLVFQQNKQGRGRNQEKCWESISHLLGTVSYTLSRWCRKV